MDASITCFCRTLGSFCKHLQTSCDALKESVDRRPIPLDSASSTFLQCLNRRVSSVSGDLNLLESMSFGTISFEELLGHCNEVYKKNQSDLIELEDALKSFGYVPDVDMDIEDMDSDLFTPTGVQSKLLNREVGLDRLSNTCGPISPARSIRKRLEEDPLFEDSLCLQDLGLSAVSLAALESEANDELVSPKMYSQNPKSFENGKLHEKIVVDQPVTKVLGTAEATKHFSPSALGQSADDLKLDADTIETIIKISQDDYNQLPSFVKSLASWEDLQAAVEKMNLTLCKQEKQKGSILFNQDELASMGFGPRGRSYLLLLLRMNRLAVETVDGLITYRVVDDDRSLFM